MDKIDAKNIKFEYPDEVNPDKDKEAVMIMNLNMWLGEYAERINSNEVEINVYFDKEDIRHVYFETKNEDLKNELMAHMRKYVTPY